MPRQPKIFTVDSAMPPSMPEHWRKALGLRWAAQPECLIVATGKAEALEMLERRGVELYVADSIVRHLRLGGHSETVKLLGEAGIFKPDSPTVLTWEGPSKDCPVLEVVPGGALRIAGHFRTDYNRPGRALYVEPVTASPEEGR
ncbi:hypothetical protein [Microbispora sp. NPDC049125]|uniref:hypothetical protein n=1 Tax=Microbispora sp. NPDC049125 TaxID=3154929 RepID=UPI003466C247